MNYSPNWNPINQGSFSGNLPQQSAGTAASFANDDGLMKSANVSEESQRKMLLLQCKSVITSLHEEIGQLNQEKEESENRIASLEDQLAQYEHMIRQSTIENEQILEEIQKERIRAEQVEEKIQFQEEELTNYRENQDMMTAQLEELRLSNQEMNAKVIELSNELQKRDHIAEEWQSTMVIVSNKIDSLDSENQRLAIENEEILMSLSQVKPMHELDDVAEENRKELLSQLLHELIEEIEQLRNAVHYYEQNPVDNNRETEKQEIIGLLGQLKELNAVSAANHDDLVKLQQENVYLKDLLNQYNEKNKHNNVNSNLDSSKKGQKQNIDEIQRLTEENVFLNGRLNECRQELAELQKEVIEQFKKEDEKLNQYSESDNHIQYELLLNQKDVTLHQQASEINQLLRRLAEFETGSQEQEQQQQEGDIDQSETEEEQKRQQEIQMNNQESKRYEEMLKKHQNSVQRYGSQQHGQSGIEQYYQQTVDYSKQPQYFKHPEYSSGAFTNESWQLEPKNLTETTLNQEKDSMIGLDSSYQIQKQSDKEKKQVPVPKKGVGQKVVQQKPIGLSKEVSNKPRSGSFQKSSPSLTSLPATGSAGIAAAASSSSSMKKKTKKKSESNLTIFSNPQLQEIQEPSGIRSTTSTSSVKNRPKVVAAAAASKPLISGKPAGVKTPTSEQRKSSSQQQQQQQQQQNAMPFKSVNAVQAGFYRTSNNSAEGQVKQEKSEVIGRIEGKLEKITSEMKALEADDDYGFQEY